MSSGISVTLKSIGKNSRVLGPRAPFELAIDDVRCFGIDGGQLLLVTRGGDKVVARTAISRNVLEKMGAEGDAWLEAARSWRERVTSR